MSAKGERIQYTITSVMAWAMALVVAFPLIWMLITSLKPNAEINGSPTVIPHHLTLDQYHQILSGDFKTWFLNSLVVAFGTTTLVTVAGTLGGYGLARFKFPGRDLISGAVLLTYLFPKILMLVPLVVIFRQLQLNGTYVQLIVADTTFALPFTLWLLRSFFQSLPVEIEHAAMVDGASRLRAMVDVVVPQALPGILSIAVFAFVLSWNDYLFALTFTSQPNTTLPVGLSQFSSDINIEWGPLMAASVAVTVPMLVLFVLVQRRLSGGLGEGGVRG